MVDETRRPDPAALAEQRIAEILRAAASWAREAPGALEPAIRAVCIRLAEMVADQRHYLAPLPEPQETERRAVLTEIAEDGREVHQRHRFVGPGAEIPEEVDALACDPLRETVPAAIRVGATITR